VLCVKELMSSPVVTVSPELPVKRVAALLVERGISAVPVVDARGQLVGIVSEADLVPLQAVPQRSRRFPHPEQLLEFLPHTVGEAMTPHVVALPEGATVAEAASLMLERAVKRIPIVLNGRVTGIVSRRDLLRALARPDAAIRAEVEELLDERVLQLGEVWVAVSGGVVHLSGPPDRGRPAAGPGAGPLGARHGRGDLRRLGPTLPRGQSARQVITAEIKWSDAIFMFVQVTHLRVHSPWVSP
jgi:CBS domain-containing protein